MKSIKSNFSSKPLISILMPVYNAEDYLENAITSILNQSFRNFEFLIIDDASTDRSWEIIKKYAKLDQRIKIFRRKVNGGVTITLNEGLKRVRANYIARMDADDWSYPNRLAKQFQYMEKHRNVGVSSGTIEICNMEMKVLNLRKYPTSDIEARKVIFRYSPFAHPATIWRTKLIKKVGGYNENIPLAQDYELYFRIGKIAKFGNIKDLILKLRTHSDSSSIIRGKFQEQFTIYTRIKAFVEYKYNMTTFDKAYTFLQMLSMVMISPKIKFKIFNQMRRFM